MAAPVLGVAGFCGFGAEGFFLAPTGGVEMVGRNAEADHVFLDGVGAALAESKVVLGRTAFVAVAFDGDASVWIAFEEGRRLLQGFARIGTYGGGIVIEVGVAHFLEEEIVEAGLGSFSDRSGSVDGDANAGVGSATGTAGGNGVRGGLDGRDGSGALGSDGADFGSDGDVGGVCSGPSELDGFASINGIAIGTNGGCGFHSRRWRRVCRRGRSCRLLVAASNKESERRKRNEQRANERAVRVNHACPPKTLRNPVLGPLDRAMVPPEGQVRGICRNTIYCIWNDGEIKELVREKTQVPLGRNDGLVVVDMLAGGPVGRFVVAGGSELMGRSAISEHGPDLARTAAGGFEDDVTTIGSPTGTLIAAGIARELAELVRDNVHDVDIVIARRTSPGKGEKLAVGRPGGINDVAHVG